MTQAEVEAALGPPLEKVPALANVPELWFYSLGESSLDDYWRRWVQFGKRQSDANYKRLLGGLTFDAWTWARCGVYQLSGTY